MYALIYIYIYICCLCDDSSVLCVLPRGTLQDPSYNKRGTIDMAHSIGSLRLAPGCVSITYGSVFDYFIPQFIDTTLSTILHSLSRNQRFLEIRVLSRYQRYHVRINNSTTVGTQQRYRNNRYKIIIIKYAHQGFWDLLEY